MTRVGILTFHHANNYGAVLQAYGLAQAVAALGHSVEVVDYRPLVARQAYGGWPRRPVRLFHTAVTRWRFRHFRECHVPLSPRKYWTAGDLEHSPPAYDCLICGSDQVWNTASFRGFDSTFFLGFLSRAASTRRVSYGATFGHTEDLGANREPIADLLSRFHRLSVRDLRSQDLVRGLTGRTAVHVLDPSFLADYGPITPEPIVGKPYIAAYCFWQNDLFLHAVRTARQRLKMPSFSVRGAFPETPLLRSAGPLEWLSLMRHAEFVCTDSFHGICFALVNRKNFVALPIPRGQSRLEDILRTVGLSERLARSPEEVERAIASPIDYERVAAPLAEAGERSWTFLRRAVE